jgi:cytochrome o ubiquinol oxidase subunit 2
MARGKKKHKQRRIRILLALVASGALVIATALYLRTVTVPVLQPAGPIAAGQKQLLITASLLMLIVVVPVLVLAFSFAWRYRETNKQAAYRPNWDHSRIIEAVWWLIPTALICILAVIAWQATYKYDPYKPLSSDQKTLTVQVVALDWRWLFIYPDYHVASINELHMPVHTPVKFEITADAPMNSFWIPQLGGQVYAMPGMGTKLHLQADREGRFYGSSANISGQGFADMHFMTIVSSSNDFTAWAKSNHGRPKLTKAVYNQLALPKSDKAVITYSHPDHDLYRTIIDKYMNKNDHMETR